MRLKPLFLALIALPVLFMASCQNELSSEFPNNPAPGVPVNDAEKVTAGIIGVVVNENDQPVAGVTVTSGTSSAVTDARGMFRFKDIQMSKANATVKVAKSGYFTAYRTFPATAGSNHNVRIKLIPKTNSGNFSAATGGTINISGGGKLVIPASAVADASGNIYSGTVNVAMTWIDPTSSDLGSIIMGDLRGVTTGGQERVLETYGMLGVELTGSGGQALNIASGKTAELSFPIPAAIQGGAPATITLWHFDEATARWKEEGSATKNGSYYITNVKHFSFWNCDAPWPQINLCMTLVNPNGQPLPNATVRIKRANVPTSVGVGHTDSLGGLCGIVPKNEPLIMEVLGPCGTPVYSQNIGPFSSSTSLGVVTVNIPAINTIIVTGNAVTCSNTPVVNGRVLLFLSNGHYYWGNINNGSFSVTLINCAGNTLSFSAVAIDYSTNVEGAPVTGSGSNGTVNLGTLTACGTSSSQFINATIDGTPFNFTSPPDSVRHQNANTPVPVPPYTHGSAVTGFTIGAGTNNNLIQFKFDHNIAPGTYPLQFCTVSQPASASQQIVSANPEITLTEVGSVFTGYIAGSFTVTMRFGTQDKVITCAFRVRRQG